MITAVSTVKRIYLAFRVTPRRKHTAEQMGGKWGHWPRSGWPFVIGVLTRVQASGPGAPEHRLGALEALDGGGTRCGARACRGTASRVLRGTCSPWGCTAQRRCPCTHWGAARPGDGPWWILNGFLLPPCAGATQTVPNPSCQNGELPHPAYKKSWALLPGMGWGQQPRAGLHDDGALRAESKVKSTRSRWLDGALQLVGSQALERWPAQCTGRVWEEL